MRELQIVQSITNREGKSLETYFHELSRTELITADEEVVLAKKIRQGDAEALNKLVRSNMRFVVSVAKKYQNLGLPLADLISEGNLGLIHAAKKFDETRGFKFISFAVWWIRQSILLAIAEQTRIVRLPMNNIHFLTKVNRVSGELEGRLERVPTHEELAELLETTVEKIDDILYHAGKTKSYDAPVSAEDDYSLVDRLAVNEINVMDAWIADCGRQEVRELLGVLSERERIVIELSFGIGRERPLEYPAIGEIVSLSAEMVRVVRRKGLAKLKEHVLKMKYPL
jgi:RNA polymerase primary sigma factor